MNQQPQAAAQGAAPNDPMAAGQPQQMQPPPHWHAPPQQMQPPPQQFQQPMPPPPHHAPQPMPGQPQGCAPAMHCYPAPAWQQPGMMPPPQAYYCYDQPQCYPPPNACPPQPCSSSAMEDYCKQVMKTAMGDKSGVLDDLFDKMGMEDKDFWKGAMIGAAAVLLLTNDNVKETLTTTLANAGEMFKSGAGKVKDAATDGAEIMKDTVKGGSESFSESVARHKAKKSESDDAGDE